MLDWDVMQWLDAGQTPIMLLIAFFMWKLERRVLVMELKIFSKFNIDPNEDTSP